MLLIAVAGPPSPRLSPPPFPAADLCTLAHSPDHDIVKAAEEARRSGSCSKGHDHLGTPRLLRRLSGNPDMLLPGLQKMRLTE